jgi:DNA-binding NarL/FixJ family response regulator
MNPIRILLADDHGLVRAGIRALLQNIANVQVIAEASDGYQAVQLVAEQHPDIAMLDVAMKGMNGIEATARILKEFPHTRVIILSVHANEEYVRQALRAGARGYLLKDAAVAELELAVNAVARGETYLSPAVSKHLVNDFARHESNTSPFEKLTPRQREILQLIAEGRTTKEIAQRLGVSIKTVETHRAQLMERLDIHDITGLVRYALRMGLVEE